MELINEAFQLPETFVHTLGESEDDHTASVLNARGLWSVAIDMSSKGEVTKERSASAP